MDLFTLALYVVVLAFTGTMVWKLIKQARADHAENKRRQRLSGSSSEPFRPKHGNRYGRRK